ncbi:MAG: glucosamine-6-phosphate deaminase [Firmicutes bacterium HGW-Firmicutes-2]|jgi:glucosamine-6-phosphate isomerase|nr:MAG: glucosamine-6-phosphate deaminase [Firmicutes bacterium HGW-Firmicutes-2]
MKVFDDEMAVAVYCEKTIYEIVRSNKEALLCLAAGHTSLTLFDLLKKSDEEGRIDFSHIKIVGLDEWVGYSGTDDGSCENFLRKHLFDHIGLQESNIRLFDGKADDLDAECASVSDFIIENHGIDYLLLGVGINGHLGLNEPGVQADSVARIVTLDAVTQKVAVKYFEKKPDLTRGVTLGISDIKAAKVVQVVMTGERKKEIVKRIMETDETSEVPATLIKNEKNIEFLVDRCAAGIV